MRCEELFGRIIDDCSIGRVQNLLKRIKRKELFRRKRVDCIIGPIKEDEM
jgi:hypothetical protein